VIFGDDDKKTNMHYGRNTNRLSSSTLRITRRGPSEPNFTIVDIPGLVRGEFITKDWVNITDFVKGNNSNTEHRTARYLVEKYLRNSRSIIV
jgi:hypothetical protein